MHRSGMAWQGSGYAFRIREGEVDPGRSPTGVGSAACRGLADHGRLGTRNETLVGVLDDGRDWSSAVFRRYKQLEMISHLFRSVVHDHAAGSRGVGEEVVQRDGVHHHLAEGVALAVERALAG